MTPEAIISLCAGLMVSLAFLLGYRYGKTRGVALGWQEAFFENVKREKSRRGRDGRFVRRAKK